jgi:hypothetical protein
MKSVGRLFAGVGLAMLAAGAAALIWGLTQGGIVGVALIPMVATLGIMGIVFFFTGRFVGGLDMGQTIANGVPATAQILSVQDSGITVNGVNMVVNLRLRVTIEGAPPYEVDARTVLSGRTSWGALQPGMTVPVKVDPNDPGKVALDLGRGLSASEASPAMLAQAVNTALASGPAGAQQAGMVSMKAADIIRDGLKVEGELVSVTPTGLTADKAAAGLTPAQADDPLVLIELRFADDRGSEHNARAVVRVPDGKAGFLAAGARVPIAYLAGRPDTATIDWDRLT